MESRSLQRCLYVPDLTQFALDHLASLGGTLCGDLDIKGMEASDIISVGGPENHHKREVVTMTQQMQGTRLTERHQGAPLPYDPNAARVHLPVAIPARYWKHRVDRDSGAPGMPTWHGSRPRGTRKRTPSPRLRPKESARLSTRVFARLQVTGWATRSRSSP